MSARSLLASIGSGAKAGEHAARVAPIVAEIKASGRTSLRAIAEKLNDRGIPSPDGKTWSSVAVMRLLEREAQAA